MSQKEWEAARLPDGAANIRLPEEEGWVKLVSPTVMPTSCAHCLLTHYHGIPISISPYFDGYEGFVERNASLLMRILEAVGRNKPIDYIEVRQDLAVVVFRGSRGTEVPEYQSVLFHTKWYEPKEKP